MERSRTEARQLFTAEQRIALAEEDLDGIEAAVKDLRRALGRYTMALVGALISTSTAALILAFQIATAKGH